MMAAAGLRDILSVPNVQQLSEDEIVIKVACMGHYDPLIGTPTPLYTHLANVCVDFIVRGQFGACGLDQVYDGIFFYDMYPIVLEKADPSTGRRYTRAELKTQFECKIRAKGLDPDDVLRQYYAVIEKVIEEADIQDVPRFAYGQAAFDHLEERGVADVYHIMHPEAMKSLSHGNAWAIVEAMDDGEDLPTLCWNFPGLELCETSDASSSVMMSFLTGEEQDVKYYTQLYEGEAEAIEYLRGLQSEAGKEAWLRLSHSGKVQVLVYRGQIDAASFQTGFGFDIGDTVALDALSDEDFAKMKAVATKACFAALPRRTQIEIRMRLGHFDAASFQTGFGFRVEDTVALDALSEDDFAEKTATACAALSRRKKIDRLVRLGTLDAASFEKGFGFRVEDTAALNALSEDDFAKMKSKATKARFAAARREQVDIEMHLGNLDAASFKKGFGFRVEDTAALNALSEDDFAKMKSKATKARLRARRAASRSTSRCTSATSTPRPSRRASASASRTRPPSTRSRGRLRQDEVQGHQGPLRRARREQVDIEMHLGNLDAASFKKGFGFRVEDTAALNALSEDDFAKMKSKATKARFAARARAAGRHRDAPRQPRRRVLQEGLRLPRRGHGRPQRALSEDDFAKMKSKATKARFSGGFARAVDIEMHLGNLDAASFKKGFGFRVEDTAALNALSEDDFAKMKSKATKARFARYREQAGRHRDAPRQPRRRIDNEMRLGNLDAASFLTGFGFAISDTVALDRLSDDVFEASKSKATPRRPASARRAASRSTTMRLGNLDAASFEKGFGFAISDTKGFGFRVEDTAALDALSEDDFAKMKSSGARQLRNADAELFQDVFGFAINDDQAIDDLPKAIFARWLGIVMSQTGAPSTKTSRTSSR
ncbi:hypothetical protein SO694_00085138 [Aureococcus anophagefferens]|uniref:Uncharacterized protein n=1 Tax=Aureococcus anophagefferens TaxID=44056 RepID=A0ABR1G499_AURAN